MAWCSWLFLLDVRFLCVCRRHLNPMKIMKIFLVIISESMAKKITDQETYLKVFVFLSGLSRTIR